MWIFDRYVRKLYVYIGAVVVVVAVVAVAFVVLRSVGGQDGGGGSAGGVEPPTGPPASLVPGGPDLPPFAVMPPLPVVRAAAEDVNSTPECQDVAQRLLSTLGDFPLGLPVPSQSSTGELISQFRTACRPAG